MNNSTCHLQPSSASSVALPIIYSFLFTTGSFANIFSSWVFSRYASPKRTQHIYLINLITANLLMCSIMPFLAAYFARGYQWKYKSGICIIASDFGTLVIHVSMYVSITSLCWTAINQYATLMKHNDHTQYSQPINENTFYWQTLKKFRQPKFAKYLCISIWFTALCVTIPVIAYISHSGTDQEDVCYNMIVEYGEGTTKTIVLIATTCFFLLFIAVLLLYYSLVNHLSKIQKNTCIEKKHLIHRTVKRNILIIQIILAVCFLPYHIFRPVFYLLHSSEDCQRLNSLIETKNFLTCLAVAKSSLDPMVSLLLDKTFKTTLYNLFRKTSPQLQRHSGDNYLEDTTPM
ncbi:PREDICTED: probable G-protein coupled receptor 82 [Crocodylus porosus]|nr:PREDICTED: probable G-protein coupled receptor 82 [Crocodylus porosus]